ncbi:hypothetical protein [Cryobacterium sp. Y29]|uniref:hypothetical protein n=1 Tax=Cryobacterium sp. Y29 TaxID=2048285 RepID=UPI0011B0A390|nr:hypothetical protein [Cryobacterium sp. Y29]
MNVVTPLQNFQEGVIRNYLDKKILDLSDASPQHLAKRRSPDLVLWKAVQDIQVLRSGGMTQRAAVKKNGVMHHSTYARLRREFDSENVKGSERRKGLETYIKNRDSHGILAYVSKRVDRGPAAHDGCWMWMGRDTGGYPSAGTRRTHRYLARVMLWSQRGFPGAYADFPKVLHQCEKAMCLNPEHLRDATAYIRLIHPDLLAPRLAKIQESGGSV